MKRNEVEQRLVMPKDNKENCTLQKIYEFFKVLIRKLIFMKKIHVNKT